MSAPRTTETVHAARNTSIMSRQERCRKTPRQLSRVEFLLLKSCSFHHHALSSSSHGRTSAFSHCSCRFINFAKPSRKYFRRTRYKSCDSDMDDSHTFLGCMNQAEKLAERGILKWGRIRGIVHHSHSIHSRTSHPQIRSDQYTRRTVR